MGKHITLTSEDGFELAAYTADPEGPARGGIVVIQEIFGVNIHVREMVDRYAASGYLAIAPAVFDRVERNVELGYTPDDMQAGIAIVAGGQLDFTKVLADTRAAGRFAWSYLGRTVSNPSNGCSASSSPTTTRQTTPTRSETTTPSRT